MSAKKVDYYVIEKKKEKKNNFGCQGLLKKSWASVKAKLSSGSEIDSARCLEKCTSQCSISNLPETADVFLKAKGYYTKYWLCLV